MIFVGRVLESHFSRNLTSDTDWARISDSPEREKEERQTLPLGILGIPGSKIEGFIMKGRNDRGF